MNQRSRLLLCRSYRVAYRMCQKSDTLLVSEFSTLVRCVIFAIVVYLHIIFIKCLISEPSVVSTDGLSSRMVHQQTHCEEQDKLPQNGECFIHQASDVASKQP